MFDGRQLIETFIENHPNRFLYLVELADVWDDFQIKDITCVVDIFSKRTKDYIHTHHEGEFEGTMDDDLIPLFSKEIEFSIGDIPIRVSQIDVIDRYRSEYQKSSVLLIGGRRTTFDEYEGLGFDEFEMSEILDIPIETSCLLWKLLAYEFRIFDKFFVDAEAKYNNSKLTE